MKRISLIVLFALAATLSFSQFVINNPEYGFTTASNLEITQIEIRDTSTILSFHYKGRPETWISIPGGSFIQEVGNTERKYAQTTEGIPFKNKYWLTESGEVSYNIIFPKIDSATALIDFGEDNAGGNWYIYDIQLKDKKVSSMVPDKFIGTWHNQKTGQWELSLFYENAIYKSATWDYKDFTINNSGAGNLILSKNGQSLKLIIQDVTDESIKVGEDLQRLVLMTSNPDNKKFEIENDEPYPIPKLKIDTAIYSGYVKNYTSRMGVKTLRLHVNDIITGEQNAYVVQLQNDGSFSVKLPIYHPQIVYVRSEIFNGSVFLEPGKELFQLIGSKNSSSFMGETARLNADLNMLSRIRYYDYYSVLDTILSLSTSQYKDYCIKLKEKEIQEVEKLRAEKKICAKAYQIKMLDIEYNFANNIIQYGWSYESAYRKKNDIARSQRKLPIEIPQLTIEDLNFINQKLANNPYAYLAPSYSSFINRIKFLDLVREKSSSHPFGINELKQELINSGYKFTESEKQLLLQYDQLKSINNKPERKAFEEKYKTAQKEFYSKYGKQIRKLSADSKGKPISAAIIEKELLDNKMELTEQELDYLTALKEYEKTDDSKRVKEIHSQMTESSKKFFEKHKEAAGSYFRNKAYNNRLQKFDELFGIQKGQAIDIMAAQDFTRPIVSEFTPVTTEEIKNEQKKYNIEFIAEYLKICNDRTIAKIEENKQNTGYTKNEVPKTEADKIFEAIISKYKGKVVYVDFWASWCGPCRSGISRVKPLKEEMAGKNVVFLYITNQTTPEGTWENMIPDIKGEHYRVSADEWNYLSSKFNISGIPHYVLVGKDGEVINPHLGHLMNDGLKKLLEKNM
jgi:thiol-disulfide isomerase/thioredoxin